MEVAGLVEMWFNIMMNSYRGLLSAGLAWLLVSAAPAQAGTVVEYYNATLDHYFITNYGPEIQALDTGVQKGWARTGLSFQTYDTGSTMFASSSPICRFYGSPEYNLDSHFYSASPTECEDVKKKFPKEWLLEADDLFRVHPVDPNTGICPSGTKAVYRLWNNRPDVNHRYTTEPAVVGAMLAKGYVLEGNGNPTRPVAFCASNVAPPPPPTGAPACTITSSAAIPVVGTAVTLTANCTGSPTSYAWINCTGTGRSCVVNSTSPGTVSYAVIATNSVATGAQASIALNWQYPASAAPVCQISANTTRPPLGTSLVLASNCSQSPASYQWMGCSPLLIDICNLLPECSSSSPTCSPIATQAGAVHYALRATNSAGMSAKVGVTVEWGGGTVPPPPTDNRPVCSISASSVTPAVDSTLTLTAACINSPTTYAWSGCSVSAPNCGCSATSNTCTTTETAPVTRNYTVAGSNNSGVGSPSSISVTWQRPPTRAPVCTIAASTSTPYVNGTLTLAAQCDQSPTSWQWSSPSCPSSSATCQLSSTTTGPASYTVAATNSIGAGTQSQPVSVTWTTPPPGGADYCSAFPAVTEVPLPWGTGNLRVDVTEYGGFAGNGIVVGRITVPTTYAGGTVSIKFYEWVPNIAGNQRVMNISRSKCDWRGFVVNSRSLTDPSGTNYPYQWSNDLSPQVIVGSGELAPGQTYYVNVRNVDWSTGEQSCSLGNCGGAFNVSAP